jgi:hypothetical protein
MTARKQARPSATAVIANDAASDDPGRFLPALARAAADRRRSRREPLSWSEAIAEAPWDVSMPAAWEAAFRRAYAQRLVERGLARAAAPSGSRSESGEHKHPMIPVRAPKVDQDRWRAKAAARGISYSDYVRRACEMAE